MNKYRVLISYYASEYIDIEADSETEAEEKAPMQSKAGLCHQCSNHLDLEDLHKVEVIESIT